jgi:hypothetical protein
MTIRVDCDVRCSCKRIPSDRYNLLVLLIARIPIDMPTIVSVTMAIGSHKLVQ